MEKYNDLGNKIVDKYGSIDKMLIETNLTISRAHLYRICKGDGNPSMDTIQKIADAMGTDFATVYEDIKMK